MGEDSRGGRNSASAGGGRTILVCGLGTSPQVVTETVQCLADAYTSFPPVGELYILTTTEGRKHIGSLRKELAHYCKEYRVSPAVVLPDENVRVPSLNGCELKDLQNVEETQAFAEGVYSLLKELSLAPSRDEDTLVVSVAGGRKAMASILTAVFSLVARPQDALVHVLMEPNELEGNREVFYRPRVGEVTLPGGKKISCDEVHLHLMTIPAPRLRYFLGKEQLQRWATYREATQEAQALLNAPAGQRRLYIHTQKNRLRVGDGKGEIEVSLTPKVMALYTYFARLKKEACTRPASLLCGTCKDCWVSLELLQEGIWAMRRGHPKPANLAVSPPQDYKHETAAYQRAKRAELSGPKYKANAAIKAAFEAKRTDLKPSPFLLSNSGKTGPVGLILEKSLITIL